MGKKLVIVESPSKSKTIEKYLGKDYKVVSSLGHIRDLSTSGKYGFGVDLEDHFKPDYKIIKGKKKLVTELKKEVKASDFVYLATDPDREGEAISWHLYDALGLKNNDYERIVFNEITKDVILNSFRKARKIDDNLVKSQEARRILDRIIGFRLSKLMQSKTEGKSAGRVQSVALKLIVDREREIQAFNVEKYYEIDAYFDSFDAKLDSYCHEEVEISTKEDADRILGELDETFVIEDVSKKKKDKKSKFPFTTSTLQQEASNKLNFTSKKTMSIAQKLYEGISLKDETVGLITYMRTDSIRMSDEFVKNTYGYIKNTYGENYVGYVKKSKKTENVQDAHEAIRPTSIFRKPEDIREYLSNEMKTYCVGKGITYHLTVPRTPQLNGLSERMNRTITEKGRSLIAGASLDKIFWGEAVLTATYLINRIPTKGLKVSRTTFELWHKRKPQIKYLKVFGSTVYVHNKTSKTKFVKL